MTNQHRVGGEPQRNWGKDARADEPCDKPTRTDCLPRLLLGVDKAIECLVVTDWGVPGRSQTLSSLVAALGGQLASLLHWLILGYSTGNLPALNVDSMSSRQLLGAGGLVYPTVCTIF